MIEQRIIIPAMQEKPKRKIPTFVKHFSVYYYDDLIKFLRLIEEKHARLNNVSNISGNGMGCFSEYIITYSHHEELSMEVLC